MAANQISNQQRASSSSAGQHVPGTSQPSQSSRSSSHVSHEANRDYGSLSDVAGQASDYWHQGEDQMRELIRDREGTAILIALATGMGVGLVLGGAVGHARQRPKSWRDRLTAEGFGRRLMDRIESVIPDALAEHFNR